MSGTEPQSPEPGRYGQLTYTSVDAGGLGGWQVKDQSGLSSAEVDLLRARIDPRFDAGVELPRFPSPDEADQLPRRLVFGPEVLPPGPAVAWWHHAPAGVDGSGRPGNVFTHVLLDRSPQAGPSAGPSLAGSGQAATSTTPPPLSTGSAGIESAGIGSAGLGSAGTGAAGIGAAGTGSAGIGSAGTGSAGTGVAATGSPVAAAEPGTGSPAASTRLRRPIDLWRSAGWLTPYGAEEVRDARLTGRPPQPGTAVGPDPVIDFLLDVEHYRLGVLSVLLDAVAATLQGGPRIVLATTDTDSAATWIAAVSHLMADGTADRFGFSTLERARTLGSRFDQGAHLCCVPLVDHAELAQWADRRFVLIAEDEPVELGDLDGQPHATAAGDRVVVTEWSVLARVVLMDTWSARLALTDIDALADQVRAADEPDALCGEPGWPLAMVVSMHLELFGDAAREASRVLVRRSPHGLSAVGALRDSARTVVKATLGTSARELWEALRAAVPSGGPGTTAPPLSEMAEQLLSVYVGYAVLDPDWLAQPGGPPLPTARWSMRWADSPEVDTAVGSAVRRFDLASGHDLAAGLALLGLTDFVVRLGLLTDVRADQLRDALDRGVARALVAQEAADSPLAVSGPELIGRATRPSERAAAVLRSVVNDVLNERRNERRDPPERNRIGGRIAREVVHWLYPQPPGPVLPQPGASVDAVRLRAELAYHCVLADPQRFARERPLALMVGWLDGLDGPELDPLLHGPAWALDELRLVEGTFPGRLPLTAYGPMAKSAPRGGEADAMLDDLTRLRPDLRSRLGAALGERPGPEHLLRLRELAGRGWWRSQQWFRSDLLDLLRGGVWAQGLTGVPFDEELADLLRAACVLAAATGTGRPEALQMIGAGLQPRPLGASGWAVVSEGGPLNVPLADLCAAAVLGHPDFPLPALDRRLEVWADAVRISSLTGQMAVLRKCAEQAAADHGHDQFLYRTVVERLDPVIRGVEQPDRARRGVERFVQNWLARLVPRETMFSWPWGGGAR